MATKKQKREAGQRRQAEIREAVVQSGLQAQKRDRDVRAAKQEAMAKKAQTEANRLKGILATAKMAAVASQS